MVYKDSTGRVMSLTTAIGTSNLYLALVTHNYIDDIRNGDQRLLREVETAKAFKLPCILLFFDNLTEADRKLADKIFHEHIVVKTYENVPYGSKFKKWASTKMSEIKKLVETLGGYSE